MAQGNIKFNVGFNVDKSGLDQLKSSLASLQHIDKFDLVDASADIAELQKIQQVATQVGAALQSSFNKDLGTYNIQNFKKALLDANLTTQSIGKTFVQAGEKGKIAFRNMVSAISSTKLELKETHSLLDKMGETLANTIRWSIASNALNAVTGSIQKAWSFTKQLDTSLNDIMIVTGKSADEMDKFAVKANNAAKALGSTTKQYADAALIYYQQGLNDTDAQARADVTVKAANVTGQSAQTVSEQLTAVWNGYKVSAQESEKYIDKLAAVAATTAADLEELSVGMSRVASAANIMGVDIDQLNAQLATIVSVTREAPESIGTALKTVYARMSDIEAGLDTETTLGEYTAQMAEMGINVLDAKGNLRDMGDVVEEIGNKWNTLNREQQVSLAQSIAGTRQYSRMMSLFDNWDQYQEALTTSQTSIGTLQKQQDIYMESLEGHLNQLTASSERLYSKLFDSDSFKTLIDMISGAVDVLGSFVESLGGGGALIGALVPILTSVFSKNISQGIATTATNFINARENAESLRNALMNVQEAIEDIGNENIDGIAQQFLKLQENLLKLRQAGLITDEQFKELEKQLQSTLNIANEASKIKAERESIDAQMKNTDPVGKDIKLDQIYKAAEEGDLENARSLSSQYQLDIDSRRDNFVEATESSFQTDEKASYTEKIKALQQYLILVKDEATQSGLVSEEEQKGLQQEIALLEKKKKYESELRDLQKEEKKLADILNEPTEGEDVSEQVARLETVQKQIARLSRAINNGTAASEKQITKMVNDLSKAVEEGAKRAKKASEDAASGIEADLAQKTKNAANKAEANLSKINLTGFIQNITKAVGAIGQLGAAINIVKNIGNIWENEDLSTGEKALQTIMNITSAAGILIPTLTTVGGLIKGNSAAQAAANIITAASETGTLSLTAAQQLLAFAKDKLTDEQYDSIKASIAEAQAQGSSTISTTTAAGADLLKVGTEKVKEKSIKATTKAILQQTAALLANPTTWIILGIVAAVAALMAGISALISAYDSEERAAEEARARAEELNKAYQDTKASYESLKESISKYKDAKDGIAELTEGTTEWKEAIQDANAQALELLKTYPELAKYMTRDANGLINISEEGLKEVQDAEYNKVITAQNASLIGEQAKRATDIAWKKEQIQRDTDAFTFGSVMAGIGNLLVAGNPIMETIGGLTGAEIGVIGQIAEGKNIFATEASKNQIDLIAALDEATLNNEEAFRTALASEEIGIKDEALIDSMWENQASILELKSTIDENNRLLAIENAQIYTNRAIEMGVSDRDAGVIGGMLSSQVDVNTYNREVDTMKEQILELNGDNEDYIKEWAAAMGIEIEEGSIGGLAGDYFEYTDAEGNEHEVSYESMAQELAAHRIHMKNTSAEAIAEQVKLLDETTKNLSSSANEAVRSIFASNTEITRDNLKTFNAQTISELQNVLATQADSLSEIQKTAIQETIDNLQDYLDNMGEKRGWLSDGEQTVQGAIAEILGKADWNAVVAEKSAETLEKMGDALQKFASKAGSESLAQAKTFFTNLKNAEEILTSINWDSETLNTDVASKMIELGETLDYTNQATFDMMLTLARLNGTFLATKETWREVNGIISNLEKHGDSLSAEDYASLYKQYGEAAAQYFTQMEDGTYALSGAAQAFYDIVHQAESRTVENQLKTAIDEFGNFGTLMDKLASTTLEATSKTGTQEQAQADAAVAAWDDVTAVHNIGGAQMSIQTLKKGSEYTQAEAQNILRAYFDSGADGASLRQQVADQFGYELKQNADGTYDYSGWDWNDITEESGGNTLRVDTDGWDVRIDYSTMSDAIIAAGKKKAGVAGKADYHNAQDISFLIDKALTNGLLSSEKAESLKEMLKDDQNLRVSGSTSPALTAFKEAIQEANKDTANIEEFASQYLKLATDSEDLTARQKYLEETYEVASILGEDWKGIISDAETSVSIKENQNAAKAYQTAINNLTNSISILEGELSSLEQIQDIVYGEAALKNLKEQNEKINEQIALLKQRQSLDEKEAKRQLSGNSTDPEKMTDVEYALKSYYSSAYGVSLETAYSTNLSAILTKIIGKNTIETEEDYQALLLAMQNKALNISDQSNYNTAQNSINTITEALGKVFENDGELESLMLTALEKNLEAFQLELELDLNLTEAKKAYNDFIRSTLDENTFDQIGDTLVSGFHQIGVTLVSDFHQVEKNIQTYTDSLDKLKNMQIVDDDTFKSMVEAKKEIDENMISAFAYEEQRQEILNSLMEEGVSLKEAAAAIDEHIISYQDSVNEAYDKYVEYIDSANSALEHQVTLMELMYGDKAFKQMGNYYQSQVENADKIKAKRLEQYTTDKAEFDAMIANREQYSKEMQDNITQQYMASAENYFASLNDLATTYQERYLNQIENLLDKFAPDVEDMKEEYDWISDVGQDYLDTLDASFAMSDLERNFTKAIDNAASVNAQKKLNDLRREELKQLQEKDKLTKYDIDRAQKRLEIAQAEIALQEAQANKSKMRLTRGADGSYSYQYVADMNEIDEKRANLEKLQQELVQLDEDELRNSLEKAYDLYSQFTDELTELLQNGGGAEEIAALTEKYMSRMTDVSNLAQSVFTNLSSSAQEAAAALGVDFNQLSEIMPELSSGWADMVLNTTNWGDAFSSTLAEIQAASNDYTEKINEINEQLNGENDLSLSDYIKSLDGLSAAQKTEIDNLNALNEGMSGLAVSILELQSAIDAVADTAKEGLVETFLNQYVVDNSSFKYGTGDHEHIMFQNDAGIKELRSMLMSNYRDELLSEEYQHMLADMNDNNSMYVYNYNLLKDFLIKHNITGFDTGGYTGEWDSSGRLALLHEKELVLNQDDTKNILSAVEMVRNLQNALTASMYEHTLAEIQSMYQDKLHELNNDMVIEQNVHITAEFPNAEDKDEIREAFEEIINLATQKVFENKRG